MAERGEAAAAGAQGWHWDDTSWVRVDEALEYIDRPGRPKGERILGEGVPPNLMWLCVGALGRVVEVRRGYPRHPCPDHAQAPDCVCGDGEVGDAPGWIPERGPCAVVLWETDSPGMFYRRLVHPEDEGTDWRRVAERKEAVDGAQ